MYRRYLDCLYGQEADCLGLSRTGVHEGRPGCSAPEAESHEEGGADKLARMPSWLEGRRVTAGGTGIMAAGTIYTLLRSPTRDRNHKSSGEEPEKDSQSHTLTEEQLWAARILQTPSWSQLRRYRFIRRLGKGSHAETFLVERSGHTVSGLVRLDCTGGSCATNLPHHNIYYFLKKPCVFRSGFL